MKKSPFQCSESTFPEEYRAFANGPLSVCVERFGGIESIRMLDIRAFDGKFYPDRVPTDIFSRNGTVLNRPFISAAIYFDLEDAAGTFRRFYPEWPEIYPFGFRSRNYDFRLATDSLCVRLNCTMSGRLHIRLSKPHYRWQQGQIKSLKNQLAPEQTSWLPKELRGEDFDPDFPFSEDGVRIERQDAVLCKKWNRLIMRIDRKYKDYEKPLYAIMTASRSLRLHEQDTSWELTAEIPEAGDFYLGMGFASSLEESAGLAEKAIADNSKDWRKVIGLERFPGKPLITVSGMDPVSRFAEIFPYYQTAAIIVADGKEVANRAAQDKFGYFAMWDHIYPARDYMLFGMPELTERSLRYLVTYPHVDTSIMVSLQLIAAVGEYSAFADDRPLLEEALPIFRRCFEFALQFVHPVTGLIRNTMACAVDVPKEVGVDGMFYEAGINGYWYNACRSLENMALKIGEIGLADLAADIARKVEQSFLKMFYDQEEGFLRMAIREDGSLPEKEVYVYTNTLALDYAFGPWLLHKVLDKLADYQARRLHHPMGHTSVSVSSRCPCVDMLAIHMNQHIGHESKCSRLGGRTDEAFHLLDCYMRWFERYRNALETFNFAYCAGTQTMNADWQTFSATAAMQGVIHGLAGLDWHRGGLFFMPAEDDHEISIENFHFRSGVFDFHCSGKGKFVRSFMVDGREITGTMQLPKEILETSGAHEWRVIRSDEAPRRPVLLCACEALIYDIQSSEDQLLFRIGNSVFAPIKVAVPKTASITIWVNDQPLSVKFCGNTVWFARRFQSGDQVKIRCALPSISRKKRATTTFSAKSI